MAASSASSGTRQQRRPSSGPSSDPRQAALAANDGPSLAAALSQSIRHHARLVDGEAVAIVRRQINNNKRGRNGGSDRGNGGNGRVRVVQQAYDPYQDDDAVSLAPRIELQYGQDDNNNSNTNNGNTNGNARSGPTWGAGRSNATSYVPPSLRDYVANADNNARGAGSELDRSVERQQGRIGRQRRASFETTSSNISSWFSAWMGGAEDDVSAGPSIGFLLNDKDDRGLDHTAAVAESATYHPLDQSDGAVVAPPGAFGIRGAIVGRAPTFYAPPAAAFRTATRHPSRLPTDDPRFDRVEGRTGGMRTLLAARKKHRRNDSLLRCVVAAVCFGLSLAFTVFYGEGRFGAAVTGLAYRQKMAGLYGDVDASSNDAEERWSPGEEEVFYPAWWEQERGVPDMEAKNVRFAPTVEYHAADVDRPRAPGRIETPFFWFVPRSGGNAVRTILAQCLRLAEASEHGAGTESNFLRVEVHDDRKFVNVDMSTSEGQEHAKDLKLVESGVPDVVISRDLHGALRVFNNRNRARIFAVLRHPLHRAISKYYADVASDPEASGMTLAQYVRSGAQRVENNYLTRYLSGKYGGQLELRHLNLAREFLRRKFVIGLASDLPASMNLFGHVFGWNETAASMGLQNVDVCYNHIYSSLSTKTPPTVDEGSEGWKLLVAQNWFDLKLYEYAEHLFRVQVEQLNGGTSAAVEVEGSEAVA